MHEADFAREEQPFGPGYGGFVVHVAEDWTAEDHLALRDYLLAHETLVEAPELVPDVELDGIAGRLRDPLTSEDEKKGILVFLAHHKSVKALELLQRHQPLLPPTLERFGNFAVDEAQQWLDALGPWHQRNVACPCGSGRKLKSCCGRAVM